MGQYDYHEVNNLNYNIPFQADERSAQPDYSFQGQKTLSSSFNPNDSKWIQKNFQFSKQVLPPDVIRITKTVAIRVPYPKLIYVPHNIPYPVPYPISKPYPIEIPKIVDLQNEQTFSNSSDVESTKTIEQPITQMLLAPLNPLEDANVIPAQGDWPLQNQPWLQFMPPFQT